MNTIILSIWSLFFSGITTAQYPSSVNHALILTKNNQGELRKALDYFYKDGDKLKIKSINFLVSNMPLHKSCNYYWADARGNKIPYNELDYTNYVQAINALRLLKQKFGPLQPVTYVYRDIDSIKANMLIEDVNLAVYKYRKSSAKADITENEFLEYILPYRIGVEPLENWRKTYADRFDTLFSKSRSIESLYAVLKQQCADNFNTVWGIEDHNEPLPRLGSLQILFRKKGFCEDLADLVTFIARSNGIAASVDNVPEWGTTSGSHFLNFLKLDTINSPHFDAILNKMEREPAKVLRNTYSAQNTTLASWLDTTYIPDGFMRLQNYIDVTQEYWPVDNIVAQLFPAKEPKVVYAAVFNHGSWNAVWYANIGADNATFRKMSKGVVYLPMYYIKNKMIPAGWPIALGYNNKTVLHPDELHKHAITLSQQENYLIYRPGKKYRLFFWNNGWRMIGEKIATKDTRELAYDNVPKNALLILIPEYTAQKERPFIILENGDRIWM